MRTLTPAETLAASGGLFAPSLPAEGVLRGTMRPSVITVTPAPADEGGAPLTLADLRPDVRAEILRFGQ